MCKSETRTIGITRPFEIVSKIGLNNQVGQTRHANREGEPIRRVGHTRFQRVVDGSDVVGVKDRFLEVFDPFENVALTLHERLELTLVGEPHQSAAELAQDLQHYLNNEPSIARPPSAMYQLRKFATRHRAATAAVATVVVVLIGAVIVSSVFAVGQTHARGEAVTAQHKAEQEQSRAEAVYEFMHHTLTAFPPGHHDITLREVLDGAAATIDGEFPDQPLVEAEVRNMIHSMYLKLGEYELAVPHAREMLAIRERELGEDDPQTLVAMNLLA